jgi:hypothetical protein
MSEPGWRAVSTSIRGSSHIRGGIPCQDASALRRVGRDGEVLILALSDGAGSARHSDVGAEIVVRNWVECFTKLLEGAPDPEARLRRFDRGEALVLLEQIRREAGNEAEAFDADIGEFSATLLGAVLTPKHALVAQVGDGAWVGLREGIFGCLTWPTGGEFVGQTTFAISGSAGAALQMTHLPGTFTALAGFTDGMERLVLDLGKQLPEKGFFLPMFRAFRSSPEQFQENLEEFLQSERVCALTDDDKSFCLAIRPNADF